MNLFARSTPLPLTISCARLTSSSRFRRHDRQMIVDWRTGVRRLMRIVSLLAVLLLLFSLLELPFSWQFARSSSR